MTLYDYNLNGVEHPKGTFFQKTEDGGVHFTRLRAVDGAPVWHFAYTAEEWAEIVKVVKAKTYTVPPPPPEPEVEEYVDPAPRAPKPDPVAEDTTDPAPRAPAPSQISGTADIEVSNDNSD